MKFKPKSVSQYSYLQGYFIQYGGQFVNVENGKAVKAIWEF
ncbi:MAG TPA: hypothetical protein VE956_24205 [Nodularia sp. (in: cyanobacteria)]|nr:hypothetical protein [Nodularia sp. (in: cyanobacteria)]